MSTSIHPSILMNNRISRPVETEEPSEISNHNRVTNDQYFLDGTTSETESVVSQNAIGDENEGSEHSSIEDDEDWLYSYRQAKIRVCPKADDIIIDYVPLQYTNHIINRLHKCIFNKTCSSILVMRLLIVTTNCLHSTTQKITL
jgi:hypothetical protein